MKQIKIKILTIILLSGISAAGQVNNLNQEVKVVKSYEPVVNDANKISSLPRIVDTFKVSPTFVYDEDVALELYKTKYQPKQIKPAKLIAEPIAKLYRVYVKGGFGMYASPMLNAYTGSQRSEKWNWNAHVQYTSSNGKIKNEDNKRVYAGMSRFRASGQVRRFFKNDLALTAGVNYGNNANYYYGYNTNLNLPDSLIHLKRKDIEKQRVGDYGIFASLATTNLDSSRLDYSVSVGYKGLSTRDDKGDNILHVDGYVSYLLDNQFLGVICNIDNYNTQGLNIDGKGDITAAVVNFNPWVGAYGRKWRVKMGVNTFYDQRDQKYSFFPDISMQYNIIDYFLLPYVELNGNYQVNDYKHVYTENPFVRSDINIKPTKTRLNLAVGFRGNISSKVAFNIKGEYANISNQYFYINDTSITLQNKFTIVYDDIMRTHLLGEISYKTSDKFKIELKGNYFIYDMSKQIEAWHMPTMTLNVDAIYNLDNKIIVSADIYVVGKRKACEFDANKIPVAKTLDGIVDANIGVEYRITRRFSSFLDVNNILGSRYYQWNHYANQRFNFMLGLTYSL